MRTLSSLKNLKPWRLTEGQGGGGWQEMSLGRCTGALQVRMTNLDFTDLVTYL